MPISIAELREEKRELALAFDGETFTVTYRPGVITPEFLEKMDTMSGPWWIENFPKVIAAWDVKDGDAVAAITPEVVAQLPRRFLLYVMLECTLDVRPGKAKSATSGAG